MSESVFAVVYQTRLFSDPFKIEWNPEIEVYSGPGTLRIPSRDLTIQPEEGAKVALSPTTLELREGVFYIVMRARTNGRDYLAARRSAEEAIDGAVALLSALLTPQLFADLVYRGWLLEGGTQYMDAWISLHPRITVGDDLAPALDKSVEAVQRDTDTWDRFRLMSKFYSKSLSELPGEEKFLWLWTVLEIFPMKSTTDIDPISEYLGRFLGRPKSEIKDRLMIGRLYGYRCDLVHNGKFDLPLPGIVEIIERMEDIVRTVINGFVGRPYEGTLDRRFS